MLKNIKIDRTLYEPIYRQIARILRERILSGKLEEGIKLPSEPDLADMLETNRLTLRKSLKLLVEQGLLVQKKGMGTFVSYRHSRKRRIGLHFPCRNPKDLDSFSLKVLKGVLNALQRNIGFEVVLLTKDFSDASSILQEYNDLECDGLVVMGSGVSLVDEICKKKYNEIPMVVLFADRVLSYAPDRESRIWIDSSKGGVSYCVEQLWNLGHRRILFLTTKATSSNLATRNEEFKQASKKWGIDDLVEIVEISNVESWYDAARNLVIEKRTLANPPTAVLCSGRVFAYGAWQGAMEMGLRIPDDISIIGMDCDKEVNPHLSTINVDIVGMSNLAGELISNLLEHKNVVEKHIHFDPEFIDRGSVGQAEVGNK